MYIHRYMYQNMKTVVTLFLCLFWIIFANPQSKLKASAGISFMFIVGLGLILYYAVKRTWMCITKIPRRCKE